MIPDMINGSFEAVAAVFLVLNCVYLYRQKEVKGVSVWSVVVFSLWGYWNLYYYPSLNQWTSAIAGMVVALANTCWVIMAIKYAKRGKTKGETDNTNNFPL